MAQLLANKMVDQLSYTKEGYNFGENGAPQHDARQMHENNASFDQGIRGDLVSIFNSLQRDSSEQTQFRTIQICIDRILDFQPQNDEQKIIKAYAIQQIITMIFHARDCRGGKGERDITFKTYLHLYDRFPITMNALLEFFPYYGRWKDLNTIFTMTKGQENKYQTLRRQIISLMVTQISKDIGSLSNEDNKDNEQPISLVGKWAPRQGKSEDKKTGMSRYIALKLIANHDFTPNSEGKDPAISDEQLYSCLGKYRKILSRLNRHLNTPEVLMCAQQFKNIQFQKVPGRALNKLRYAFLNEFTPKKEILQQKKLNEGDGELSDIQKYDNDKLVRHTDNEDRMIARNNFKSFIQATTKGKVSAHGKSLFPHEIVQKLLNTFSSDKDSIDLLESQWRDIEDALKKQIEETGGFKSGLPMIDVSGSMHGTPLYAAIALGILVSKFLPAPWTNKFLTFSEEPIMLDFTKHKDSIYKTVKFINRAPWGGSTDFMLAHEQILNIAKQDGLNQEELPNMLYVFSDMQFNEASRQIEQNNCVRWKTIHEQLKTLYQDYGLNFSKAKQPCELPHTVYWNLRGTDGFPVTENTQNAQMISGFSAELLKVFMKGGDFSEFTPYSTLNSTISDERYNSIRLVLNESTERELQFYKYIDDNDKNKD